MRVIHNKKSRKLIVASAGCAVSSIYFAGSLQTLSSPGGHTWNPFRILAYMLHHGFPFSLFLLCFLVLSSVGLFFYWSQILHGSGQDALGRNFIYSRKRQSYGQSHFEAPHEYETKATIERPETAKGMILGQLDDSGKRLISQRLDSKNRGNHHIAVLGSSGSGKTYSIVKPACFQIVRRRESVIITDPDGGLFRDMATYFQDHGYVVRHFDLTDIRHSDGWDCLKSIDPTSPEDAQTFAQTVIANLTNSDDMNSIYATGPKALLTALILRVLLDPDIPSEQKNIEKVYSYLQNRSGEAYLDEIFFEAEQVEELRPCLGPYLSFKQGSPNLRGNLITNLSIDLQLLQNKSVSKLLSTDDIDLELPGKQPCAYFCGFPDNHSTYNFIVSLFFSMIFIKLIHYADVVNHGRLDVPVNFLLDEFPSIGRLPDWHKKMATIRKRRMNVIMIFQDIMQFQNIYERSWGTILGNCATLIVLGINEAESADLVSKRVGDTTIEAKTEQRMALRSTISNWFINGRDNTGEGRRALLASDELFKLPDDDEIILFQGHNPILCKKYPFILHPESKKLRHFNYDTIPDLDDTAGRKQMRQEETKRIEQYVKDHFAEANQSIEVHEDTVENRSEVHFDEAELLSVDILQEGVPPAVPQHKEETSTLWIPSWRQTTAGSEGKVSAFPECLIPEQDLSRETVSCFPSEQPYRDNGSSADPKASLNPGGASIRQPEKQPIANSIPSVQRTSPITRAKGTWEPDQNHNRTMNKLNPKKSSVPMLGVGDRENGTYKFSKSTNHSPEEQLGNLIFPSKRGDA